MKLALPLCLSFLLAVPQLASANAGLAAAIGAMAAASNNYSQGSQPPPPPRLYDEIRAIGFVATSQEQCEARHSAIHVSPALCTKALEIARKEHAQTAPVYRDAASCAAEHPVGTCIPRAAISEQRREVRVFQPAFTGAVIFKTPDDRFGVNAVMAGHHPEAWTRANIPGIAYLAEEGDSRLPGWLVVDYGGAFGVSAPSTRNRMGFGQRTDTARRAGCPGYGYAMTAGGHCPLDRWLDPAK